MPCSVQIVKLRSFSLQLVPLDGDSIIDEYTLEEEDTTGPVAAASSSSSSSAGDGHGRAPPAPAAGSIRTVAGRPTASYLTLPLTHKSQSGRYECTPSNTGPAAVYVHIIQPVQGRLVVRGRGVAALRLWFRLF